MENKLKLLRFYLYKNGVFWGQGFMHTYANVLYKTGV